MIRTLILGAAAVFAALGGSAEATRSLAFDVFMNGDRVGRHSVTLTGPAGAETAQIAIDMAGAVGPIRFSYSHRCTEQWDAGAIKSVSCKDTQGKRVRTLTATRVGDQLQVQGHSFKGLTPMPVLPSSWYRAQTLTASSLLDTRNGRVLPVRVRNMGAETLTLAEGPVAATRYRVRGTAEADIWYDAQGRWVGMKYSVFGQRFEYRKVSPLASAPRA
jgi:hypothetical protein